MACFRKSMKKGNCPNGVTGAVASHSTWTRSANVSAITEGTSTGGCSPAGSITAPGFGCVIMPEFNDCPEVGNHRTAAFRVIGIAALNRWPSGENRHTDQPIETSRDSEDTTSRGQGGLVLFQSPKLSGRSRQGIPVRYRCITASTNRRLSTAVTPTEPARPGNSFLIRSHWSSRSWWGRMGRPLLKLTPHESKKPSHRKPQSDDPGTLSRTVADQTRSNLQGYPAPSFCPAESVNPSAAGPV